MARSKLLIACPETNADLLYLAGFRAPDAFAYLETAGKKHILLSDLEIDRGRAEAKVDSVEAYSEFSKLAEKTPGKTPNYSKVVATWLHSKNVSEVKVPTDFPFGHARDLKKSGIDVKPVRGPFVPEREIKSRPEVHALENAIRISEIGMTRGIEVLRASKILKDGSLSFNGTHLTSELLRIEMETAVVRAGGEARGDTIVAGGQQACDPHHRGTGQLFADQLIILDIFPRDRASWNYGDMTRTYLKGKATPEQRRMVTAVKEAHGRMIKALRAGKTGAEIHRIPVDYFQSLGYHTGPVKGTYVGFFHGSGHGLGYDIHEEPYLSLRNPAPLQAGNAITVEPGLYYPGIGGCRFEDCVVITAQGCELLSKHPYRWEIA